MTLVGFTASAIVTMLPSILMSGFKFPFEGMPVVAQGIAQVLPLTHFNETIRGIVLRFRRRLDQGTVPFEGAQRAPSKRDCPLFRCTAPLKPSKWCTARRRAILRAGRCLISCIIKRLSAPGGRDAAPAR